MPGKRPAQHKPLPDSKQIVLPLPETGIPENKIHIGDATLEIRPTKLKYMRNHTAAFYRILELYPLADVLAMEEGAFDDQRDGDKALFDWIVAVTDDADFVESHYDEMDTDMIEAMLSIFRRVNKIDDKEERQKNLTETRREAE